VWKYPLTLGGTDVLSDVGSVKGVDACIVKMTALTMISTSIAGSVHLFVDRQRCQVLKEEEKYARIHKKIE
jgi:hypothetical protein